MTGEPKFWHHYRTCNLCEAMCGLDFTMQGRSIVKIEGDRHDAFSRGHICPKAVALQDIHNDPNRLKRPLRRTKNGWREIGWAEAFDETTDRIKEIQAKHGRHAFGSYQGNPGVHNYGTILFFPPFIRTLKSKNIFSASSVDQLPHMIASYFMFGHQLLLPIPDINRTQHLLILGANPAVSNGSLMTAPDVANRIREIRARGGKVTVVDPRRTETAHLADEHHFIRPGADAFLLLGVLHVIFAEKLENPRRVAELADNLDTVRALVADFAPEAVADITGISAPEIKRIAREFAKAESAVCYARVGVSTQEFGTVAHWLVNVLNIVTGNFDREGGSMFANPAIDPLDSFPAGHYGVWKSRVRGLPEFAGELPVAALAEEILTEGEGKIRGLLTVAGNPVLSTPNGKQLESALAGLEFMASVDIYVNETTRHAHIILPPTGALEHENYDLIFHLLAIENTAKYSPALFAPDADARHDWQIFLELHTRMLSRSPLETLRAQARKGFYMGLGPEGMLDLALRSGAYGAGWNPFSDGLHLEKIKASPHGVHLGPLRPSLPGRLRTKTKRIELAPAVIVADVQRVREKLVAPAAAAAFNGDTLLLIGRRHLRSNNSWMHNSERLVKGKPRCTLLMHPNDARKRNLADGQTVRLDSRVGGVEVPVEITDEVMPGVVSLPHGWGHNRPGVQLDVARRLAGASVNDVTDERFLDALSGNASFNGVPVRVTAA